MNWKNVKLVFLREVRDQLRDRRTLFMIAVLPLLLYPAMGIGMVQLTLLFAEQPRTVVLLGEQYLPPPELLDGDRFVSNWFPFGEEDARKLEVITDGMARALSPTDADPRMLELLQRAEVIREKLLVKQELERALAEAHEAGKTGEISSRSAALSAVQTELGRLFAASGMQVLVIIPEGFDENVARTSRRLTERSSEAIIEDYPRPILVHNKADEKSQIAYTRVREAMDSWENAILSEQLASAGLPATLPTPIKPTPENLALDTQIAANLWSKLFPALLVIMSVTGAFYPAIDLGAGEKERGTMETLLICPASRTEIVFGKFFTVMCFSIATALLNLLSLGLTGQHMASMVGKGPGGAPAGDLSLPSAPALMWTVILLIPLAALFSALCLALATFARSSKEGQYYLTPLLMATLGVTAFCMSPGVELTPFYSIMPVAGVALLLKGLLLAPLDGSGLYFYAIPVLLTTLGYGALAIWWAVDQFQREDVLFREAERFELGLWIRHLFRDKEATPSFTEAAFCFVLIMLLQFATLKAFSPEQTPAFDALLRVLMIQQVAIIASPALFMGVMLTTSMVRTFRLRLPRLDLLLLSVVLAVAAHPLSLELSASLSWFFPPLDEGVTRLLHGMANPDQPLWTVLLAFAFAPAICEELAFRGFILSGFSRTGRTWLAIILSSIAFGVMHIIPQQVFNAALLGILLGLIAVRSNSLFPCILFHFTFNSLAVLHGRFGELWKENPPPTPFLLFDQGQIRYPWLTLAFAAAVFAAGVYYLLRQPLKTETPEKPLDTDGAWAPVPVPPGVGERGISASH